MERGAGDKGEQETSWYLFKGQRESRNKGEENGKMQDYVYTGGNVSRSNLQYSDDFT